MDLNEYAIEYAVRSKLIEAHEAGRRRARIAAARPPRRWRERLDAVVASMAGGAARTWSAGLARLSSAVTSPAVPALAPASSGRMSLSASPLGGGWLRRCAVAR